jgi:excisionase family DNA binding protein
MAQTQLPVLRSPKDLAESTTVPRSTWYSLVARREIPAVRIGRSVRIDERDALAYINANRDRVSEL